MRTAIAIVLCTPLGLVAGCANVERYYGNIYEGLRTKEAIVHPLAGQQPAQKPMSYQAYAAERKKLLERDDEK